MRFTIRALTSVVIVAGCPYDPATPEFDVITDTDGSTSSGSATLATTTIDPDTDAPTTTAPTTTSPDTTVDSSGTDPTAECGDGEVNGDEICDDGTNDGAYGGCMPGCGAAGPSCGDGEVNGPEACDDGINDGSYGGCVAGCGELAPYCGDGTMQGPEQCDNGAANENGSGCNIDCVESGTVVGTYVVPGLSFCDGAFTTPPVFRADGNVLVSASGYCDQDSVLLAELSPTVELVQEFDDLLLPQTPVREATMAGDAWLLASYGCTYAISPMGELTEVCEDGRIVGGTALDARDDASYIALDYDLLGSYPAGSPMAADSPDWQVAAVNDGFYDFNFYAAAIGASDAAIVVGSRRQISNNDYVGYLARYTAAGNSAGTSSYPSVDTIATVAVGPDGSIALASGYPNYRVMHLDDSFDQDWGLDVPSYNDVLLDIDSTGAVVIGYVDSVTGTGVLRKWTADGQTELWSVEAAGLDYGSRMAIAPGDDSIWISTASFNGFGAAKISP